MSNPSLTPVATGTTSVFSSDPVVRFQQAVDVDLQLRDLERRVQRLARSLTPRPATRSGRSTSHRQSRYTARWWPTA